MLSPIARCMSCQRCDMSQVENISDSLPEPHESVFAFQADPSMMGFTASP